MGGDDSVARSLLSPELLVPCVRFSTSGVSLRAPTENDDEDRTLLGMLMLVRQHPNAMTAFDTFVLWVPYSFLSTFAPSLLTPAARAMIVSDTATLPADLKDERMAFERAQTICVCLASIAKLHRKTNLRGRRSLIIHRQGRDSPDPPLAFSEGGSTPFLDEIRTLVELRPLTGEGREAWSVHCPEPQPPATDLTIPAVPRTTSQDAAEITNSSSGNPQRASHVDVASPSSTTPKDDTSKSLRSDFEKDLYGQSSRTRGFMGTVLRFGKTVADKSLKAVSELSDLVSESPTAVPPPADDSEFDIVDSSAALPVEKLVPQVAPPPNAPRMGPPLKPSQWNGCFDADGRLNPTAYAMARETAFRGGIDPLIRAEVWPFLLGVFPLSSTAEERQSIRRANQEQYQAVQRQWMSVSAEQADNFTAFRERKAMIEKDVARTDRRLPQFSAEDAPLLRSLFNVLMTYSFFNFDVGYCQGMSDFLAPILLLYEEEEMSFAVFKALMGTRTVGNFYNDARHTMSKQLDALRILSQFFLPKLFAHLEAQEALDMTFAFRWLLVYFKREFPVMQIPLLWDVLFACPFTTQYEIFMVAALLRALAPQIIDHALTKDELIRFANAVNGNMKVEDLIVMTADFYDVVSQQVLLRKRTAAAASGVSSRSVAKDQRPSLDDILKEYSPLSSRRT